MDKFWWKISREYIIKKNKYSQRSFLSKYEFNGKFIETRETCLCLNKQYLQIEQTQMFVDISLLLARFSIFVENWSSPI